MLADALAQTRLAGHPDEYFRPDTRPFWSRDWGIPPDAAVSNYISAAINYGTTDNGIFTAKLHWFHFAALSQALRLAAEPSDGRSESQLADDHFGCLKYVHVSRRDTARQAVSYYRAIHSGIWFVIGDASPRPHTRVPERPDFRQIRWLEEMLIEADHRWLRYFELSNIAPLEVTYEELVAEYDATLRRVLDFLGAELPAGATWPRPSLHKQSDELTELWLADYRRLRELLPARPTGTVALGSSGQQSYGTEPTAHEMARRREVPARAQPIARDWLRDATKRQWFEDIFGWEGCPPHLLESWANALARTLLWTRADELRVGGQGASTAFSGAHTAALVRHAAQAIAEDPAGVWLSRAQDWLHGGALDIYPPQER